MSYILESYTCSYICPLQAQYNFLHEALVEALLCPNTAVPCERFPHVYKKQLELEPRSRKTRLQCEFEVVTADVSFKNLAVRS